MTHFDTVAIPVIDGEVVQPAMTWCRACGGGGDFFDGQDFYSCGICGGLGEHPVDVTPYGVAGSGIEASYDPDDEYPTVEIAAILAPAPATAERPIVLGLPVVAPTRYARPARWGRVRAAVHHLVHGGWTEQRLLLMLAIATVFALIFGLAVMEHFYPSDALGGAR